MQNRTIKKSLVVGIIFLFIGIGIAPNVTSIEFSKTQTSNNDLVEITLQLCKTSGVEDHKMYITQEQNEQLDVLIESFKTNINNAETREETIEIYKDMVVSLDKLGILPESTNCKEVQEFVTGKNSVNCPEKLKSNKYFNQTFEKLKNKKIGLDENSNMFCLISGETDDTETVSFLCSMFLYSLFLRYKFYAIPLEILPAILSVLIVIPILASIAIRAMIWFQISNSFNYLPSTLGGLMTLGYWEDDLGGWVPVPSVGWVSTNGLNGIKKWDGYLLGGISSIITDRTTVRKVGAIGFTGLKFNSWSLETEFKSFYLGSALWVRLV